MSRVLMGREMGTVRVEGENVVAGGPARERLSAQILEICSQARISFYVDGYMDFSKRAYTPGAVVR